MTMTAAVRSGEVRDGRTAPLEKRGREVGMGGGGGLRRPALASDAWQQLGVWVFKIFPARMVSMLNRPFSHRDRSRPMIKISSLFY